MFKIFAKFFFQFFVSIDGDETNFRSNNTAIPNKSVITIFHFFMAEMLFNKLQSFFDLFEKIVSMNSNRKHFPSIFRLILQNFSSTFHSSIFVYFLEGNIYALYFLNNKFCIIKIKYNNQFY